MQLTRENLITRIINPSQEEFIKLYKQGKPFIINGVANNWNAYINWSNEYLIKNCGNNKIPVETYDSNFYYKGKGIVRQEQITFQDYIDIITGKRQDDDLFYYMAQVDFHKYFPQLIKDIIQPKYFSRKLDQILLFFGSVNEKYHSKTLLHFDEVHNIFVQIRGKKRLILFPPKDYLSLYPKLEGDSTLLRWSKVDPENSKYESFPNFPWQEKIEIILEAGEILYIPPFWWHHVTALNENISLTFWYPLNIKDFFNQKGTLSALLSMAPHIIPRLIVSKIRRLM